mmetsp:Transcript_10432/g.31346  ORF Transcript_10432/g.31346 Transcript_10432/m.31346 type:complete len:286 (+) Transcript_10432:1041-1898(+)
MKTRRSRTAAMQAVRFMLVRRSSSMTPILSAFGARPRNASALLKSRLLKATSSGPCIFGLTMYTEPARLLRTRLRGSPAGSASAGLARSNVAALAETKRSTKASGTASPPGSRTISVCICMPTLRHMSTARPGRVSRPPPTAALSKARSCLSRRCTVRPDFSNVAVRPPRMSPAHVRYTFTLSSASTAATLSSKSQMAVKALSRTTSLKPQPKPSCAARAALAKLRMTWRPLCRSTSSFGQPASPRVKPTSFSGSASWASPLSSAAVSRAGAPADLTTSKDRTWA